jgi:hypothetical protein
MIALFSLKENKQEPSFMQVLFTGEKGRTFYSGMAPQSGTADIPYRTMPLQRLSAGRKAKHGNGHLLQYTNRSSGQTILVLNGYKRSAFSRHRLYSHPGF